jgi:Kef-type K+ transport system membrane component KefB
VTFATLAVIAAVALLGPVLALPGRWHIPVVFGELIAGIALGKTGIDYLHADNETFTLLADIGFALVMFVAGTHVPVRDPKLRPALRVGVARAVLVGVVATVLGALTSVAFGTGHPALYAVLMASSSAALVLPIVDSLKLGGEGVLALLPQIAIADAVCIVALPLAIDPAHAGRAAVGAALVLIAGGALYAVLNTLERRGIRGRLHDVSEDRKFAFELRIQLTILFALAALAVRGHVSIMLAGFTFGLAVSAVGQPRRLAKQLFALTEGFLGPVFFVWLGASLNLRELGSHPKFIALGACLGVGAAVSHLAASLAGQRTSLGLLAAAQLGIPVAAATIGQSLGVLKPGESSALMLGALVTIALAVLGAGMAVRRGLTAAVSESG